MTTASEQKARGGIPLGDRIGYGIGNFPVGISIQVVGAYLVFFSTTILKLPGSLVGLIVSIGIIWDAVTDPIMGYVSDHTNSRRFGRRHLYLLLGAIGMAGANWMVWAMRNEGSVAVKFALLLLLILMTKTFMTVYTTPYTALGAEMSADYDERTAIQGTKTVFFLVGLAFVTVFGLYVIFAPTEAYPVGQLNPAAYPRLGMWTSLLILVFGLISFFWTLRYVPILRKTVWKHPGKPFRFKNMVFDMVRIFKIRPFRSVALTYMFNNIASAIISNIGLHVFTFTFGMDSQKIAIVVGAQFATSIVCQPAWSYIAKRLDKRNSLRLAITISIISCFLFGLLVLGREVVGQNILLFLPFSLLAGFGLGGMFTLPLSMMSDVIDVDELGAGERQEGIYFGSLTLFYKFSQSITLVLVGGFLDLVRFDADLAVQHHVTAFSMGMFFAVGSLLAFIFAFVAVSRYTLSREDIAEVQRQLKEKADAAEATAAAEAAVTLENGGV